MTEPVATEPNFAPEGLPKIKKPRKGAKPHEVGQRPWTEDPDIMNRVLVVGQLTWPATDIPGLPIKKIASMLKVAVGTVHEDRQRFLTLERKKVAQGREAAIDRLNLVIAEAFRGLQALPASNTYATHRPKYLDVIEKAAMSIAKLDGSLDTKPQLNIGIGISTGASARELWQQGTISDVEYEASLRIVALTEQPIEAEYRALPAPVQTHSNIPPSPPTEGASPAPSTSAVSQAVKVPIPEILDAEVAAPIEVNLGGLASFEQEPDPDEDEDDG